VIEIARAIGSRWSKSVKTAAVSNRKETPALKNVFEYERRLGLLQGAFEVEAQAVRDQRILLVDDLYRSGATATVVAQALLAGGAPPSTCSR
jgi:predicted amidophosphoribosyltransferase